MGTNIDRKISSINWAPRKKLIKRKGHFANTVAPLFKTTLKITGLKKVVILGQDSFTLKTLKYEGRGF